MKQQPVVSFEDITDVALEERGRPGCDRAVLQEAAPSQTIAYRIQPGTGIPCCSIADCRPVEYRLATDGYEALLDARWVRVPDDKILRGMSNPLARGVVCRSPISGTILCFVPANET